MTEPDENVRRRPSPDAWRVAGELYQAGDLFGCHEMLERVWRATEGSLREFYRGLIQVVVGLYHAQRGNRVGARAVLARGLARMEQYPEDCLGMDWGPFRQSARRYLEWLETGMEGQEPARPLWPMERYPDMMKQ